MRTNQATLNVVQVAVGQSALLLDFLVQNALSECNVDLMNKSIAAQGVEVVSSVVEGERVHVRLVNWREHKLGLYLV